VSKTVYYSAKPGSLATMYVTPAARFAIERRMKPGPLESDAPSPWVLLYNVKGQKVWECNEQFFDAHFIKCPPEEKPRLKKPKMKKCKHCDGTGKVPVVTKAEKAAKAAANAEKLREKLNRIQNYWKDKP
jgi:hypothetical protein